MKQLKFMLAAATAIGLASAAQAGYLSGSTDFEGDFDLATEFTYSGTAGDNESAIIPGVPTDVERPANNGFTATPANVLQVNTGTEPIVRSVDGTANGASLASGDVYVDTLVQFTVTPDGDTVTPGASDKLMVYLKESKNGDTATTNLIVHAGSLNRTAPEATAFTVSNVEVESGKWYRLTVRAISNLTSEEGMLFPAFSVSINGTVCQFDASCVSSDPDSESEDYEGNGLIYPFSELDYNSEAYRLISANKVVLSLVQEATIKAVGFAGEGKVDDLVISTFDPAKTVVDFTLALADVPSGMGNVTYETPIENGTLDSEAKTVYCYSDNCTVTVDYTPVENYTATWSAVGEGATAPTSNTFAPVKGAAYTLTFAASAPTSFDFTFTGDNLVSVTYTIDNGTEATANKGASITVEGKTSATVKVKAIKLDPLYVVADESATKVNGEYEVGDDASLVVTAKALTGDTGAMVPEGTTAADIGIENSAFASAGTDQLNALVKWATASGKGSLELVNSMEFNGDEPTDANAKAFLLDCAPGEVDSEDDKFKLTITFDDQGNPVVEGPNGAATYKNGKIVLKGRTSLSEGDWEAKTSGHKFFKAFLTK